MCVGAAGAGAYGQNPPQAVTQPVGVRLLDGFEAIDGWKVIEADGVKLAIAREERGEKGACIRLDYDFTRGSGYGIIRKEFNLPLSANYRFGYSIRGEGPSNTVEFKLLDESGDNVWWLNERNFAFPKEWRRVEVPRRKVSFAWGPSGGAKLEKMRWLEIAITSFNGGKGTVWLDELTYEQLPEISAAGAAGQWIARAADGTVMQRKSWVSSGGLGVGPMGWSVAAGESGSSVTVEMRSAREFGGLALAWKDGVHPDGFEVQTSLDGETFSQAAVGRGAKGNVDYVVIPSGIARVLKIIATDVKQAVYLESLKILPVEVGDSANELIKIPAQLALKGWYPRQFVGQGTFWTVAGVSGSEKEILMGEDGAIEVEKQGFSIEPFVVSDGNLWGWWSNTPSEQWLEDGYLPIPSVRRRMEGMALEIKAGVAGAKEQSTLRARYELTNTGSGPKSGVLYLAVRPFQVNPVQQMLNTPGGVGRIGRIACENDGLVVDGRKVRAVVMPASSGAARFDEGEVVEHVARGDVPQGKTADDASGLASGAMSFPFDLKPGEKLVVPLVVGLEGDASAGKQETVEAFDQQMAQLAEEWRGVLDRVMIELPVEQRQIQDAIKANLAYILINRDGAAIQPGSRSYERSWIRDGSLTSAAMMALGHVEESAAFCDWFAGYQYENGKVPCCADKRGPDPVAENDSHGQYIWLVLNCFRHSQDAAFLKRHWPHVQKAVAYMETLRAQRMTPAYKEGDALARACYGLLPESISHEGYSAKPMHSYWDQFFAMKGLADAATIAELVGDSAEAARIGRVRDSFRETLVSSVQQAMAMKSVAYVPGCVELGDFDATSTTVALWPCGLRGTLPESALQSTFEKYWAFFKDRRDGKLEWDGYTPYENRIVGSYVLLDQRERAAEVLAFLMKDQRPTGWRHWAEVVWRDPRKAQFIGDMPHTWCGSDFLNSVRVMFAHERGADGALVLGAGVPRAWARGKRGDGATGVRVQGLVLPEGKLSLELSEEGGVATVRVGAGVTAPAAGVWLSLADAEKIARVEIDGKPGKVEEAGLVRIGSMPCTVKVTYRE